MATVPGTATSGSNLNLGAPPTAHHAGEEHAVEFRSQTVLVQVPVVVADKSGKHVHDLKKEDFHVFENGNEQRIGTFDEVAATTSPVLQPVTVPQGEFTNLVAQTQQPQAVTVIAVDTINTPFLDQAYARKELLKYLANNLNPAQPAGLVIISSRGVKIVHGLTTDSTALLEVIKKLSGSIPEMQNVDIDVQAAAAVGDTSGLFTVQSIGTTQSTLDQFVTQGDLDYAQFKQENAIETTLQAFLELAWSLSGVPGRKTVIWATGSFPFYMDSPDALPGGRLSILYERAVQALNDAEMSVYPVDVRGLVNYTPAADASRRQVPFGPGATQQMNNRSWLQSAKLDTLQQFAEVTGGRAFFNTNDLAGAFQRATDEGSSYYVLGYYLDTKNTKPGWRQLKVKLDVKNVEIRARQGFLVTNTTMNPEITRDADMAMAVSSGFEATGLPLIVKWKDAGTSKNESNSKQVEFLIHLGANSLTVEGARNRMSVDFLAIATQRGAQAGTVEQNVSGALTPQHVEQLRSRGMSYTNVLDLAPGVYSVRFVVRDNLSGRIGTVNAPLTVN